MKKTLAFRKTQIGNMDRNEKIRSYNFQRNMITDHRIEKGARQVSNIVNFINGELVRYSPTTSTVVGLDTGSVYAVRKINDDTIQLSRSKTSPNPLG